MRSSTVFAFALTIPLFALPPARAAAVVADDEPSHRVRMMQTRAFAEERVPADQLSLASEYQSAHTGVWHVALQQRVDGLAVHGAVLLANFDAQGRMINRHSRLASAPPPAERARLLARARLGPRTALSMLSRGQVLAAEIETLEAERGPQRQCRLRAPQLSRDAIPAEQVWFAPRGSGPATAQGWRVAWTYVLRGADPIPHGVAIVDASNGRMLATTNWRAHDSYRVFPAPARSPDDGKRVLLVDPADSVASPFGWHDTNGSPGAESNATVGNNAVVQDDLDANDAGGSRPTGGSGRNFDFPLDLAPDTAPVDNFDAALTQVFATVNWVHDVHYRFGFDEPAGNFQSNNYGMGGSAGDAVVVDALDGADTNNASFGTPPDGFAPLMQLHLFDASPASVDVTSPIPLAGPLRAGEAAFGPVVTASGTAGTLVRALDAVEAGGTDRDACSPLSNSGAISGNLALVDRGLCTFVEKVEAAQASGATGVIVANNAGDAVVQMNGSSTLVAIPSLFIGESEGERLEAALASGVFARLIRPNVLRQRDGGLSNDLLVHEYSHGVTNRLTGGPANVGCLQELQSRAMGEGWSDFYALAFTAAATDDPLARRGFATWVNFESLGGTGLRSQPYSTDPSINTRHYGEISLLGQPHGAGEVWASALWDLFWSLVGDLGFSDLVASQGVGEGGNALTVQLVTDALALQPCNPTYLDARDALLSADQILTGGANECRIWEAMAKRGMGASAGDGGSAASTAVSPAFDVPVLCPEPAAEGLALAAFCGVAFVSRARRRTLRR